MIILQTTLLSRTCVSSSTHNEIVHASNFTRSYQIVNVDSISSSYKNDSLPPLPSLEFFFSCFFQHNLYISDGYFKVQSSRAGSNQCHGRAKASKMAVIEASFSGLMRRHQVTDFMNMFTGVVDRCFKECANDFTTKAVTGREVWEISIDKEGRIDSLNLDVCIGRLCEEMC